MVKPSLTTASDLNTRTIDISKSVNTKVVSSSAPARRGSWTSDVPSVSPTKMKVDTEHEYIDVAQFLAELMEHKPLPS